MMLRMTMPRDHALWPIYGELLQEEFTETVEIAAGDHCRREVMRAIHEYHRLRGFQPATSLTIVSHQEWRELLEQPQLKWFVADPVIIASQYLGVDEVIAPRRLRLVSSDAR